MKTPPEVRAQHLTLRNNIVEFTKRRLKRDQVHNDLALEIARLFRSSDAAKSDNEEDDK